jgi:hypothetical protein
MAYALSFNGEVIAEAIDISVTFDEAAKESAESFRDLTDALIEFEISIACVSIDAEPTPPKRKITDRQIWKMLNRRK